MKSILAGAWPPLKPLPVFKYETVDYRATIDFDRRRGEWVCRKTSLPSNKVQELRGGLREITMQLTCNVPMLLVLDTHQPSGKVSKALRSAGLPEFEDAQSSHRFDQVPRVSYRRDARKRGVTIWERVVQGADIKSQCWSSLCCGVGLIFCLGGLIVGA